MPKDMKKEDIVKVIELLDVADDDTFVKELDVLRTKLKSNAKYTNEEKFESTLSIIIM